VHVQLGHRWSGAIRQLLETITGWWCNNHLEKYESQWEGLSHNYIMEHKMFETSNQIIIDGHCNL